MTAVSQHHLSGLDTESFLDAAGHTSPAASEQRGLDDRMRFLDALFAEAESLVHGPRGNTLSRTQSARLDVLMAEIDQLMGDLDTVEEPPLCQVTRVGLPAWDWDEIDEQPLFSFDEPTQEDEIRTAGLAALEAFDPLYLSRLDGPLTLDVETALDRITAQLDLGVAMDIPPSELLAPLNLQPLSPADVARIDAVFSCMDRILAEHQESLLSPAAQTDLEALMREADRILGLDLPDAVETPREKDGWRRTVASIGEAVARLMPGHGGTPQPA